MFLNFLKNLFTKKIVKNKLSNVSHEQLGEKIKTIGILIDESYVYERQSLVTELVAKGMKSENISVLVFKNKIKKNEEFEYPAFSYNDLSWRATFSNSDVRNFIARDFDLLINYYDVEKSALLIVSDLSKAKFKVGFAAIDKKLNHFMIDTAAENHKVFTEEMVKYLKILNKL